MCLFLCLGEISDYRLALNIGKWEEGSRSPQAITSALRSKETFPQCKSVDPSALSSLQVLGLGKSKV